jgi:hypothetical protein
MRAIVPRGVRVMVLSRIPSNQILFFNSKKEYLDKMDRTILNICKIAQSAKYKDVLCKMPLATKVFNRKKWLGLWAPTSLSLRMYPFTLHSNEFPARRPLSFTPKISHFS